MKRQIARVLLLGLPLFVATCAPAAPAVRAEPETRTLPSPREVGPVSLEFVLAARRSVREFDGSALSDVEIGQLLWAAQGVTDDAGRRTAPSAGALYPLELFAIEPTGVSLYRPETHDLVSLRSGDVRPELAAAALDEDAVRHAPFVVAVFAVYERTASRYGTERGRRYATLEAGHAAQNVLLQAVSLGLGAVPIGAFDDGAVRRVLDAPAAHAPLYLIAVGRPRS